MHPTQLAQWAGAERQRRSVALQVLESKSWRRRPDSNRRIGVLQTPPLDHLGTSPQFRVGCPSRIRTSVHGFKVRCPTTRRRGIDPGSPRDWSGRRDSNPRPSHWQCDALPTELTARYSRPLATTSREVWCPDRDLNPDDLRHTPLKRTRIPIPPPGHRCRVLDAVTGIEEGT